MIELKFRRTFILKVDKGSALVVADLHRFRYSRRMRVSEWPMTPISTKELNVSVRVCVFICRFRFIVYCINDSLWNPL